MKRSLATFGLVASLCAWTAQALAGALDVCFDNTIRITSEAGEELIYFNRDGTFTSTGPAGDSIGTWKIDGDTVCTKTRDAEESCGVMEPNRSVGDRWENELNGETITIEILPGR